MPGGDEEMSASRGAMNVRPTTLRDLLSDRLRRRPDDLAYAFLVGNELQREWTYSDLCREVAKVGAYLGDVAAGGKRALLVYPQGLEFVAAFLACLCRNVVAVPVPAPETWNLLRTMPRLKSIADDAAASLVLTSAKVFRLASGRRDLWDFERTPWMVTDDLPDVAADLGEAPIDVSAPAYLQYTSGSTSSPSGVVLTHRNLMRHLAALHDACGYGEGVTIDWMPHFHDYGLVQGLLQPLFSGDACYFMSPLSFLKRPAHWLEAISRYRGTHSQAPNFAYDHCVRRISEAEREGLDLSSWKAAGNAAEPINSDVLETFIQTFEPVGFRRAAASPAYGLAEATLLVSSTRVGAGPLVVEFDAQALAQGRVAPATPGAAARKIVGCGELVGDTKVVIVDPERRTTCRPDQIGEIWVSDPAVAVGYWNDPAKSEATFAARLSDTGDGPWMRTGDLGFLRDGQLFISGRYKDMIIIRGANFAPQDIEWASRQSHPAAQGGECVAFPMFVEGEERLGLVQELNRTSHLSQADLEDVASTIRETISLQFEIRAYAVALVRRGTIPKTSSGKLQRRACRAALLTGELPVVFQLGDGPLSPVLETST
jgi:acyl-CoA synthetase (AMP-forming)/AMP-acid ligase II